MKYKKKLGTVLMVVEKEYIIQDSYDFYSVNEVAARIFSLCDGQHSEIEIIKTLGKFYELTNETLEDDIRGFMNYLYQ